MKGTTAQLAIDGGTPVFSEPIGQNLGVRKVGAEEAEKVAELVRDGVRGDPIGAFCKAFTQEHDVRHGVAVDSGTAAVHVGVVAAGVEPGDEVILPAISDVGSVKGILAHNAIPIFADVDLHTYNIDPADVESKITDRTKAIIAVHLYGQPAQMDELMDIGRRHNVPIIEDCAQAHFAEYKGQKVGSIGDIGVFSFITGKHMTTITGGMVMTNNDAYAKRAELFSVGRGEEEGTKEGIFFRTHVGLGLNYRMNPLGAAVGLVQLDKLDDIVARRRETGQLLDQLIGDIPGLSPPHIIDEAKHAYWLYAVTMEEGAFAVDTYAFARALQAEGVSCMPKDYYLLYDHPAFLNPEPPKNPEYAFPRAVYDDRERYYKGMCPNAERGLAAHIVITWSEFYTQEDVYRIEEALRKVADSYRA